MSHCTSRYHIAGYRQLVGFMLALSLSVISFTAIAGDTERRQAKRMHDRIAGVPASNTVLDTMESLLVAGTPTDQENAAREAMKNPAFYNVTLKNFAAPWTNEAQSVFVPLNDYTATIIGMIRDDIPFNQVLSADLLYMGNGVANLPLYSMDDNNHYEFLENQGVDLSNTSRLVAVQQSSITNLPAAATAGVVTSRAAARAFFIGGTNRAMFRFTMMNHLCNDLEPIKDTSRSPDRIRQDVTRSPGGDSRIFMNACVGCHAGMDPLAQAYAYYEYVYNGDEEAGRLVYTPGSVQGKYLINPDNFKYGYITPDDRWDNYWRAGPNSLLGWDTNSLSLPVSGNGAKSMGIELANSEAFASCQVKKVFKTVCFREPTIAELGTVTTAFKGGYNMKYVFAKAAVACRGN